LIPVVHEGWSKCYRIISSRFPPVSVFEDVADPRDLEAVYWVEGLTNPCMREELGAIGSVAPEDRIAGEGTTPIMAAFTHMNPTGSRFSDGTFGVYYGARCGEAAIAETVHHLERWAGESNDPPTSFTMRMYVGELTGRPYHDIRGMRVTRPELYDPDITKYGPPQALAAELRRQKSWGLIYDSVRLPGNDCIAAFRPNALGRVRQSKHLAYIWDGTRVVDTQLIRSLGVPGR
jgi:hypothetical protein